MADTTNMNAFELAMQLGTVLKNDERVIRMERAKAEFESNEEISALMTEYEIQQKALENVAEGGTFDPEAVQMIQDRLNEIYKQISEHPACVELSAAQDEANVLMEAINNTITFAITGQVPTSCSGNCSSCGGGCH